MTGRAEARDVVISPQLAAGNVSASIDLRNGILRLEPIQIRQQDGTIGATVELALATPAQWQVSAEARQWPVELRQVERGALSVSGETNVTVNLRDRAARGPLRLVVDATARDTSLGTTRIAADLDGRKIRAREINGSTLGGSFVGQATLDLDAPLRTTGELNWKDIDAAQLATLIPRLADSAGMFDGSIRAEPANDPRALAPLRIEFNLAGRDASYRRAEFAGAEFIAFAAPDRIVTESAKIRAAGGEATAFARLSRRPDVPGASAQLMLEFENLSLDQLVHVGDAKADPMPGRLAGSLRLAGNTSDPRDVFGDVFLSLSQSDLANLDAIRLMYDLMRVGSAGTQPSGTGAMRGRLENNTLHVTGFRMFNRGVDVRGVGDISELFSLPDSSVRATLVGSARPLKDLRLPFLADVDQILSVVQANVTTVRIEGTVRQPKVRTATFDEIGEEMRQILLGEVKPEK
jgi:hypothetical protein